MNLPFHLMLIEYMVSDSGVNTLFVTDLPSISIAYNPGFIVNAVGAAPELNATLDQYKSLYVNPVGTPIPLCGFRGNRCDGG